MKKRLPYIAMALLSIFVLGTILFSACQPIIREIKKSTLKMGFVFTQEQGETFYNDHVDSLKNLKEKYSLKENQIIIKNNVRSDNVYKTLTDLADECDIVILTDKSAEDMAVQAATENKNVDFCVLDGVKGDLVKLDNFHNYLATKSYSWYLAGVAAGFKLDELVEFGIIDKADAKIGFIAPKLDAENISAYTAFYLGAKSVFKDVKMGVKIPLPNDFTFAENVFIANKYKIIASKEPSEHFEKSCRLYNTYYIMDKKADFIKSSDLALAAFNYDWVSCYGTAIDCFCDSKDIPAVWSGGKNGLNIKKDINIKSFYNIKDDVLEQNLNNIEKAFADDKIFLFDTARWTVDGEKVRSTATENLEHIYSGREYIEKGIFKEYEINPRPMFSFHIDGIDII